MRLGTDKGLRLTAALALALGISSLAPTKTQAQTKTVVATTSTSSTATKPAVAKSTSAHVITTTKVSATTKPAAKSAAKKPPLSVAARKALANLAAKFPTYGDPTIGDDPSRDDPAVRAAAVSAIGDLMGAVVVVDPGTGRVLTVVNQQQAFGSGYQPCSVFKPAVALAALGEGIIEPDHNKLELGKKWQLDLHKALAVSNNLYFEKLGRLLGVDKLEQYAHQFGIGERAGWGIAPEPAGAFPDTPPPASMGGVGRIASFGQGISLTMFELAGFTSALSNGGTLYYLQYPAAGSGPMEPKVKRELTLGSSLEAVRDGMEQAVIDGTARRGNMSDMHVLGKTGTCSQDGARLGWFTGYNREAGGIALVVLLRTGLNVGGGGRASQVAGQIFRQLDNQNFYARNIHNEQAHALPAAFQLSPLPQIP